MNRDQTRASLGAWRISICVHVDARPPRIAAPLRHPARRARRSALSMSSASWRTAMAYSGLHSASNPANNIRSEKAAGCHPRRVLSLSVQDDQSYIVPPMCLVVIRGEVKVRPGVLSPAIRISYVCIFRCARCSGQPPAKLRSVNPQRTGANSSNMSSGMPCIPVISASDERVSGDLTLVSLDLGPLRVQRTSS